MGSARRQRRRSVGKTRSNRGGATIRAQQLSECREAPVHWGDASIGGMTQGRRTMAICPATCPEQPRRLSSPEPQRITRPDYRMRVANPYKQAHRHRLEHTNISPGSCARTIPRQAARACRPLLRAICNRVFETGAACTAPCCIPKRTCLYKHAHSNGGKGAYAAAIRAVFGSKKTSARIDLLGRRMIAP